MLADSITAHGGCDVVGHFGVGRFRFVAEHQRGHREVQVAALGLGERRLDFVRSVEIDDGQISLLLRAIGPHDHELEVIAILAGFDGMSGPLGLRDVQLGCDDVVDAKWHELELGRLDLLPILGVGEFGQVEREFERIEVGLFEVGLIEVGLIEVGLIDRRLIDRRLVNQPLIGRQLRLDGL
jgi:hypothetical protein